MSLKAILLSVSAILLACTRAIAAAQTGCSGPDDMQGTDCRSWIRSDRPVYAVHDGKLYRTHFNTLHSEVLADHGSSSLMLSISADGRYLSYAGASGVHYAAYVYDTVDGAEHLLPAADARPLQPVFSPDSSKLAWADIAPQAGRQNIVIMDLADRSMQVVHDVVDVRALGDYRDTKVRWSADGRQLLVGSVAYPQGAYYRISLPDLAIAPIDGRYVSYPNAEAGMHFDVGGRELAYYREPCLQWQCGGQGRAAPGESVHIDRNNRMTVVRADGVAQVVARGGCDLCGDASVRALSWLERGNYLVYEFKGAAYVYGVAEGRTSRLFDPGWQFGWQDNESRAPALLP